MHGSDSFSLLKADKSREPSCSSQSASTAASTAAFPGRYTLSGETLKMMLQGMQLDLAANSALPAPVLVLAGVCTSLAVVLSAISIYLQLKNYHKPYLQRFAFHLLLAVVLGRRILIIRCRMVVRIMLMVPIYAVSSLISLFSLRAAFFIDAIRDVYEVRTHISRSWHSQLLHVTPCNRLSSFIASSIFCSAISVENVPCSFSCTAVPQYFLSFP